MNIIKNITFEQILLILAPVLSFFGALAGARINRKTQLETTAVNVYITARIKAYAEFEAALAEVSTRPGRAQANELYAAGYSAILLSNDKTFSAMNELLGMIRVWQKDNENFDEMAFYKKRAQVLILMHDAIHNDIPDLGHKSFLKLWLSRHTRGKELCIFAIGTSAVAIVISATSLSLLQLL